MFSFSPPRRIVLQEKNTNDLKEYAYLHAINEIQMCIERKEGTLEILNTTDYDVRVEPSSNSIAEAELRVQGARFARIQDDRKPG